MKQKRLRPLFQSPRPSENDKSAHALKPSLSVALKLEVAKAPANIRATALETAYLMEDLLYAVENDLDELPPAGYHLQ